MARWARPRTAASSRRRSKPGAVHTTPPRDLSLRGNQTTRKVFDNVWAPGQKLLCMLGGAPM
eukprot:398520-Prymnesium_polylepis.1